MDSLSAREVPNHQAGTHHLYVHVPFCERRCSYCDFSIAVRTVTPVDEYLDALECELRASGPEHWALDTIYVGGGTPSRLGSDGIARLLDLIRSSTSVRSGAEITIEANPNDVTPEITRAWRSAGVNRVSLGVQSFQDNVLAWMHRTHVATQAEEAIETLQSEGIINLSVDLIFAVPASLGRNWRDDLDRLLKLSPSHISLYGLTVESHTPLGRWVSRGEVQEATDEQFEEDFLAAHDLLEGLGFEHYEVSNYGKPGQHSRHNRAYWKSVPYAALGPSAHRFDGVTRSWNVRPYTEWLTRLRAGNSPVAESEQLTAGNLAAERVYLGLRTADGLVNPTPRERALASQWTEQGWARIGPNRIQLTPSGWLRLDSLAAALLSAGEPETAERSAAGEPSFTSGVPSP